MSLWLAGAALVGGVLESEATKSGARRAATATTEGVQAGIAQQDKQFERLNTLLAPHVQAGGRALQGQEDILGLGGPEAQQLAIEGIESSPQFAALVQQSEEALLQNAAATGGVRGGNLQSALQLNRPRILNDLIERQFSRLGSISQLGQASAAGVGAGAIQTGISGANLIRGGADANAQAELLRAQANKQLIGDVGGEFGQFFGNRAAQQPIPEMSVTF